MSDAANRINQGLREALIHAKGENFLKFVTKNSANVEATPPFLQEGDTRNYRITLRSANSE